MQIRLGESDFAYQFYLYWATTNLYDPVIPVVVPMAEGTWNVCLGER
jgi:hypothetical protein